MSSKVYRPDDLVEATPMCWRPVASNLGTIRAARTESARSDQGEAGAAELQRESEARIEAARQQGFAAGEAAGAQRAAHKLEPVFAGLNGLIAELAGMRKRFRAEAEEDTVKLAIAIARRVLHRELATDPDAMLGLVKAAFGKLNARETHRLRVSPSDATAIEQNRARLELPPRVEISSDSSLTPGHAIFETSRGDLDASVDTQLGEIQHGFADIMKRRAR